MYARNDIINAFDKKTFPHKSSEFKTKEEKPEKKSEEKLKKYINNTFTFIEEKSEDINNDLFAKNIKSKKKNNKFKISAPTWNDTFDF